VTEGSRDLTIVPWGNTSGDAFGRNQKVLHDVISNEVVTHPFSNPPRDRAVPAPVVRSCRSRPENHDHCEKMLSRRAPAAPARPRRQAVLSPASMARGEVISYANFRAARRMRRARDVSMGLLALICAETLLARVLLKRAFRSTHPPLMRTLGWVK
jgi:hypothetical protein